MSVKKIVYGGFFVALGVVLPMGFHLLQLGGSIFLPMHIPVLLAGFILEAKLGAMVGVLVPFMSYLFTGMPPLSPPILPIMLLELLVYGFVAGYLYKLTQNLFVSLVGALISGRVAAGMGVYVITLLFGFHSPVWVYISGAVLQGIPGIILQCILIPILVKAWEKHKGVGVRNNGS